LKFPYLSPQRIQKKAEQQEKTKTTSSKLLVGVGITNIQTDVLKYNSKILNGLLPNLHPIKVPRKEGRTNNRKTAPSSLTTRTENVHVEQE
jgi:hypothetical protein